MARNFFLRPCWSVKAGRLTEFDYDRRPRTILRNAIIRRFSFLLLIIAGLSLVPTSVVNASLDPSPETNKQLPNWNVYFSPKGGCTQAIVDALGQAKQSVLVQAYSFTSFPIVQALIEAEKRGVKVEAIIDAKQIHENGAKIGLIAKGGVPTYLDGKHAIAHNKVMVIDGKTVITGSFNFTAAAEKSNAENLLIIQDERLARRYLEEWSKHKQHSETFYIR